MVLKIFKNFSLSFNSTINNQEKANSNFSSKFVFFFFDTQNLQEIGKNFLQHGTNLKFNLKTSLEKILELIIGIIILI